jgi:IclR family acetate operon transcriptional repressor
MFSGACQRTPVLTALLGIREDRSVMPNNPLPDQRYEVRSVARALELLELLASGDPNGQGVSDLARRLKVSKSTAFSLLQTLCSRGFVADTTAGGARRYRLGLALARLGDRVLADIAITDMAMPLLQQMMEETGLTARLAILDEGHAVAVARVDAPGTVRFAAYLGRRELPHCSAVGKAMLAALPRGAMRRLVRRIGLTRRTARTITDPRRLEQELDEVTRRGYAFDDEEDTIGVFCVGACARGRDGAPAAAISVTGLKIDRDVASLHELGATVRRHADRLSILLGGPTHAERQAAAVEGT